MATRSSIAARRKSFEEEGLPSFKLQHGDHVFSYFVLPQKFCPDLPHFAMQMVANDKTPADLRERPDEVALFGVSDLIPEAMQPIVAQHEMYEYIDGLTCPQAAARELERVIAASGTAANVHKYVIQRITLFRALVPYAEAQKYPMHKIAEFAESLRLYNLIFDMGGLK